MNTFLLRDLIANQAANKPTGIAYICGNRSITWREIDHRSERLAAALQAMGAEAGQPLGILAPETIEVYEHFFACFKLGAIRVGINRRFVTREILHIVKDSKLRVLLVHVDCLPQLAEIRAELDAAGVQLIGYGGDHQLPLDYEQLIAGSSKPLRYPDIAPESAAMYAYTSGTTGLPKGVILPAQALKTVIQLAPANFGFLPDDLFYCPLGNAWAAVMLNLLGLANGMTLVIPDREFNTLACLKEIERLRVTAVLLAPTMLQWAIDELETNDVDVSSVRLVAYGSAPATPRLIEAVSRRFGCDMVQGYGVSESCAGWITTLSAADHRKALAGNPDLLQSAGRAPSYFTLSIRDEQGREVPQGEVGEVWVKSETLMLGYLNLQEQTEEVMKDGWLITNDMGVVDADGYLYLKDRRKFMIVTGGVNVFPAGVEAVMAAHPAIAEIAVIGVPHKTWGEAVVAVVHPRAGSEVNARELLDFCQDKLSRVMQPKHVHFTAAPLPKSANLKVQKHLIQSWFKQDPSLLPADFN